MKKTISILGSTGSIGTQTLEVVRNNPDLQVAAISGNKNIELLAKQILEFSPKLVCVYDENQTNKHCCYSHRRDGRDPPDYGSN